MKYIHSEETLEIPEGGTIQPTPTFFPVTDSNARRRRRQCPASKRRIEHQCGPNTTESSRLETARDISTKPDPA